jgi:hypothetical protein
MKEEFIIPEDIMQAINEVPTARKEVLSKMLIASVGLKTLDSLEMIITSIRRTAAILKEVDSNGAVADVLGLEKAADFIEAGMLKFTDSCNVEPFLQ